jgi:predicted ribosomally synthesized peptide with nif11-like leader
MAKEDALRFMMIVEKDKEIKSAFNSIMTKYEGKNLSKDEWNKAIQNEVIPFAKKYGYDFTAEDLAELQRTTGEKVSDEELDQVVGGRGEFREYSSGWFYSAISTTFCDFAPDDQTFKTRYDQYLTDCPDYVWTGKGASQRLCACCAHCQNSITTYKR